MSKMNAADLVKPAVRAAMLAAERYLHLNKMEVDDRILVDALKTHVKAKIGEALEDARLAIECRMYDAAEQTFLASMVLAGIEAAKEVGKPSASTAQQAWVSLVQEAQEQE